MRIFRIIDVQIVRQDNPPQGEPDLMLQAEVFFDILRRVAEQQEVDPSVGIVRS